MEEKVYPTIPPLTSPTSSFSLRTQEEAAGKTKKLKKVWTMYMAAKSEMADLQQEHQREMEGLLENVRQLSRELKLHMLIIDSFIPQEYQNMIEQHVHWNEGE